MSTPDCTTPKKTCTKCGSTYPITTEYWYKDKSQKSGFQSHCKKCDCAIHSHWQKENAETRRTIITRWRIENPEQHRANKHRRRARKRSLPNTITAADIQYALNYFKGCCAICGRPLNGLWHTGALDHWIPLASPDCPGSIATNELPLCQGLDGCNNEKNDKYPTEWLIEKYGNRKANVILKRIKTYFSTLSP